MRSNEIPNMRIYMNTKTGDIIRYTSPKMDIYGDWIINCYVNGKIDKSMSIYEESEEDALATMASDCKQLKKLF